MGILDAPYTNPRCIDLAEKRWGAKFDGTTDDTNAIQAALNTGRPVLLPNRVGIASNLTFPSGAYFHGLGISKSIIRQKAGSTGPLLSLAANWVGNIDIGDFGIDGNKDNQSAANIGLDLDNTADAATHRSHSAFGNSGQDPRHTISNLMIWNTKGSGLRQQGRGAGLFQRIWTMDCAGHGFEILGYDNLYTHLDAGSSGKCGIYLSSSASSDRFTNIKSWYSGQADRSTYGQGIFLDGARSCQFSAVEVQNSGNDGIKLLNANFHTFSSTFIEFPPNPANTCDGLVFEDSNYNLGDFAIWDRGSPPYSLRYGMVLRKGAGAGCTGNDVRLQIQNQQTAFVNNQGGQSFVGNRIDVVGRYTYQARENRGYLPSYASDSAAATGGLSVGDTYFSTASNAYTRRQS